MNNKGFTILEILIAVLVITIGILAAYSVTQQIVSYTLTSASRITAAYLAKEGIEITRNSRDTNWLQDNAFNNGLTSTGWEGISGFPNYERRITIDDSTLPAFIKVFVEVSWERGGQTHSITVQENIYDWK